MRCGSTVPIKIILMWYLISADTRLPSVPRIKLMPLIRTVASRRITQKDSAAKRVCGTGTGRRWARGYCPGRIASPDLLHSTLFTTPRQTARDQRELIRRNVLRPAPGSSISKSTNTEHTPMVVLPPNAR
ncbi:hypothetical protein BS78_01G451100 [Paspalum vaginatum]|nr:hypothetical protein BS78_01G451100 [Paspalum vaginatum]